DSAGIFARRFDAAAMPLGASFQVNTVTRDVQRTPGVAVDAAGNAVIVWTNTYPADSFARTDGVARRYDAAGVPLGPEFRANTSTAKNVFVTFPTVAASASGDFVLVWRALGSPNGIFARPYADPAHVPVAGKKLLVADPGDPARRRVLLRATDP